MPARLLSSGARALASIPPPLLDQARGRLRCRPSQLFREFARLGNAKAFAASLTPLRRAEWVVYAKRPFGGPEAVLAYLSRYTHRVAIANSRLLALDDKGISFKWKDYRIEGPGRYKTMTLATNEFIRQFLIHVLPRGFHRIRHYGLFAKTAADNLTRARQLLGAQKPQVEPADADHPAGTDPPASAQACPAVADACSSSRRSNAVRRHAIDLQSQSSPLNSTRHEQAQAARQHIRSLASPVVGRNRQNLLKHPTNRPRPTTTHSIRPKNSECREPKQRISLSSRRTPALPRINRGTQIPIAQPHRFRPPTAVSSLGGFRTPAAAASATPVRGRHPKTFTTTEVGSRSSAHRISSKQKPRGNVPRLYCV